MNIIAFPCLYNLDGNCYLCFVFYRNVEVADEDSLPESVKQCLRLLTSDAMFLILSNITGLRLHPLAADSNSDDETESSEPEPKKPRSEGDNSGELHGIDLFLASQIVACLANYTNLLLVVVVFLVGGITLSICCRWVSVWTSFVPSKALVSWCLYFATRHRCGTRQRLCSWCCHVFQLWRFKTFTWLNSSSVDYVSWITTCLCCLFLWWSFVKKKSV